MKNSQVLISRPEYERISTLLGADDSVAGEFLAEELGRAEVVSTDELPNHVVKMNSEVTFEDCDTSESRTVRLVYPHEADIENNKISILSPLGAALIGIQIDQEMDWPTPNGKTKRLRVIDVKHE